MTDTSEALYGLPKQPENTCPAIDSAIRDLRQAMKTLESAGRDCRHIEGADEIEEQIDDGVYQVSYLEEKFEHCRSQCEDIRAWGQAWKDLAKELLSNLPVEEAEEYEADC